MGIPLPDDRCAVAKHTQCLRMERPAPPLNTQPCIRCGLCADACPEHLLPQQLHWQLLGDNLPGALAERLPHCILCGCCDMVCPSEIPLSQQFAQGKVDLRLRQHTEKRAAKAKVRVEARNLRLEAKEREKQERLAKRKSGTAKTNKQKAVAEAMARSRAKKAAGESKNDD
jgi:electron transport complex protein RnfC